LTRPDRGAAHGRRLVEPGFQVAQCRLQLGPGELEVVTRPCPIADVPLRVARVGDVLEERVEGAQAPRDLRRQTAGEEASGLVERVRLQVVEEHLELGAEALELRPREVLWGETSRLHEPRTSPDLPLGQAIVEVVVEPASLDVRLPSRRRPVPARGGSDGGRPRVQPHHVASDVLAPLWGGRQQEGITLPG
jgi:hypothetical protein